MINLNKGMTTQRGLLIILGSAVIVGGAICLFQYFNNQPVPYIKINSPDGGELWIVGEHQTIRWEQNHLEELGNKVDICITGFTKDGEIVSLKEEAKGNSLCDSEAYLIGRGILVENNYGWIISSDFLSNFSDNPYYYKITTLVFDYANSVSESEPKLIEKDESDSYFNIIKGEEHF